MSKVIILTGPSAAGKTTAAKRFLENADGVWTYISQDDVHSLILSGYESANGLKSTWNNEVKRQWQASIDVCCAMVNNFNNLGINCIVDCSATATELSQWLDKITLKSVSVIALIPDLKTAIERNSHKIGNAKLSDEKISSCIEEFQEDAFDDKVIHIKTTGNDIEKVIDMINKANA